MKATNITHKRQEATALIRAVGQAEFVGCLDHLSALKSVMENLAVLGAHQSLVAIRKQLLDALDATMYEDIESEPCVLVESDHIELMLSMAPFLEHTEFLSRYIGQSSTMDMAILHNLAWCLTDDPEANRLSQYCNILKFSNPELAVQLLDLAFDIPELTQHPASSRNIINYISSFDPWPGSMKALFNKHLPAIEHMINLDGHWLETMAIIPNLCNSGFVSQAQTLFNNIKFEMARTFDPQMLDITYSIFGAKGISDKLPQFLPTVRGRTTLSSEKVEFLLNLVNRYPNIEFAPEQWKYLQTELSTAYFAPAVGRFLRSVVRKDNGNGRLTCPDAVNHVLETLLSHATEKSAAKKMLIKIAGDEIPKSVLLQLECLQEDILATDLGL